MTARRPIRLALLISSLLVMLSASAAAQTSSAGPSIHPLTFVTKAAPCVHHTADAPAPEEWKRLLRRAQIWSLLYGTSMADSFAKKPAQRPTTCAADMKRLEAEFQDAETKIFMPGWRKGRTAPPANALMNLDPAYTAGWCGAVAHDLGQTARNFPSLIGLDRRSEQGRKQIDGLLRELSDIAIVMLDWEDTSTWTRATKGKPLDHTFLSRLALDDYSTFYWPPFVGGDEADAAVLRLAGVKLDNPSETAKSPAELIRRLRLNVELGTCRAAAGAAKFRLMDP